MTMSQDMLRVYFVYLMKPRSDEESSHIWRDFFFRFRHLPPHPPPPLRFPRETQPSTQMKRTRDEQESSAPEKGQDPTQPPMKIARRTNNTGVAHPDALYSSLYSSLLEDLSSETSDSSESSDFLSSISSLSSDSSSVQRIAKRLDKVRKKILESDRRVSHAGSYSPEVRY